MRRSAPRPRAVLAALLALVAPALPASDLLEVLAAAEQMDPLYREAQAQALSVAEGIPQARAELYLPSLSFSGSTARVRQDISAEFAFGGGGPLSFTTYDYRINLTQPVYHRDRVIALAQADRRVQQAQLQVLVARQDLMVRVAERYFDVLAARDNLAFAQAEKDSLARQLEQAEQRFEVGLTAITDVQEAQAGHDRAVAAEISAANQIENSEEALREITEAYYDDLQPLGENVPLAVPQPLDLEAWTATALDNNLDLAAAGIGAEIAHHEIRRQYAQHAPRLDVVGGHGYTERGGQFGATKVDQSDIGLELTMPIYEGGRVVSRTRQAEHDHQAAVERLEQTRRSVQRQTREAYLGIVARISSVKALRQAVVSSQTALDSTRAGFDVGTRTAIDVVAAERSLSQARRDYARARYDYILDTLRLKRAAGSLAPDDLQAANAWLTAAPAAAGEAGPTTNPTPGS